LPEWGNGNFARLVRTASWGHIQEHWYWTRKILSALTSGASGDDDWWNIVSGRSSSVKWRYYANYGTISHCRKNLISPLFLFQDSNLRNLSATTPASAQFTAQQLLWTPMLTGQLRWLQSCWSEWLSFSQCLRSRWKLAPLNPKNQQNGRRHRLSSSSWHYLNVKTWWTGFHTNDQSRKARHLAVARQHRARLRLVRYDKRHTNEMYETGLALRNNSSNQSRYCLRVMLTRHSVQGVRAFERVGSENLHFPSVAFLWADDQHSPIPPAAGKHMLDNGDHVPL